MRALCALVAAVVVLGPVTTAAQSARSASTGPIEIGGMSESRCSIWLGDMPETVPGNATAITLPVQIDCNTPFTLYGHSAAGYFTRPPANGAAGDRERIGYTVLWPAGLIDGEGRSIAQDFNASGATWQQGLVASSAATRQPQQAVMTIRLNPSAPSSQPIIPDTMSLQIEAN